MVRCLAALVGLLPAAAGAGVAVNAERKTLQDDPVFQPKKYQRNIEEDPECSRDPLWGPFRVELLALAPELRVDLAYQKTLEWGLDNATVVDEMAKVCIVGSVCLQYLFARFLLLEAGSAEAAAHTFRMLDSQAGALHPDLFDKASGNGEIWPITAEEIDGLRRKILRASVGGGTGGPSRRRRFRNAFGLHDE
ncbi:unnamed protein product, partial [Prorocentrum cordatum]